MKRTRSHFRSICLLVACLSLATPAIAATDPQTRPVRTPVEGSDLVTLLPPDGIPAIDEPEFVTAAQADSFLTDSDPVLGVVAGDEAKAYGLWYLDEHEIVNDRIGGQAIAATW